MNEFNEGEAGNRALGPRETFCISVRPDWPRARDLRVEALELGVEVPDLGVEVPSFVVEVRELAVEVPDLGVDVVNSGLSRSLGYRQ